MDTQRWVTLIALSIFLFEGFVLSVFPDQVRQMLIESEPRSLQVAGLIETVAAIGLAAVVLLG